MNLNCEEEWRIGLIGAAFLLGIVIGCLTLTKLGDIKGRKPIYQLGIWLHIVGTVSIIFITEYWTVILMIISFGMSVSSRYYVGYTYNMEL